MDRGKGGDKGPYIRNGQNVGGLNPNVPEKDAEGNKKFVEKIQKDKGALTSKTAESIGSSQKQEKKYPEANDIKRAVAKLEQLGKEGKLKAPVEAHKAKNPNNPAKNDPAIDR